MKHRLPLTPEDRAIADRNLRRLFRWDMRETARQKSRYGEDRRPPALMGGAIQRAMGDMLHFAPPEKRPAKE